MVLGQVKWIFPQWSGLLSLSKEFRCSGYTAMYREIRMDELWHYGNGEIQPIW